MKIVTISLLKFLPLLCLNPLSLPAEAAKQPADLLITGGTVVTMDGQRSIYDDGAVAVTGDTIIAVGPSSECEAKYTAPQTTHAENKPGLPGFINGQTQVPMTP